MTLNRVVVDLEERLPDLLVKHDLPGLSIGICDSSGVLWSAAFGVLRAGESVPAATRTMFNVQSCSKMYTATAVLLAVQAGLVDLDTPILYYLPEFRVHSSFEACPERRITLRHLLSHTAGFTHTAPVGSSYRTGGASFEAHCLSISDTWLRFPVGHHYEYSNLGVDLAGYILQRTSGLPFSVFLDRHLFGPLDLHRTTASQRRIAGEPDRAIGHYQRRRRLPVRIPMVAAGGVYTSVDDALRYLQFHLTGGAGLLDPALLAEMDRIPGSQDRDQGYSLGLALVNANGMLLHGHSGGGFGFLADMYWSPELRLGVAVLTNSVDHPLQWNLAMSLFRELSAVSHAAALPQHASPATAIPPPTAIPAHRFDAFTGSYVGRFDQAEVMIGKTGPVLIRGNEQPIRFTGPAEFVVEHPPYERFRFSELDGNGDAYGSPLYLESLLDGQVRYRNDVPPTDDQPAIGEANGVWNRNYTVRSGTMKAGTARLRNENGIKLFEHWEDGTTLRLYEHAPDLYVSSTGEMLDLRANPPTFANVQLWAENDKRVRQVSMAAAPAAISASGSPNTDRAVPPRRTSPP